MRLEDWDFDLPEAQIALRPVRPRRAARLLVVRPDGLEDRQVADLPELLSPADLMVFNDTRVLPARLTGERRRESRDGSGLARIEATLIRRLSPDRWEALTRPARRLRPGDRIAFGALTAEVEALAEGGRAALRFDRAGPALDAAVEAEGAMPLPPYIARRRPPDAQDREDYQSVFAEKPGAVAAPTASLHFDAELLAALAARGLARARVTLHVGAGTFLPVTEAQLTGGRLHAEWGEVPPATAQAVAAARARGGRVVPVGTTALRVLETAAAAAGGAGADREVGEVAPWVGETDLFIRPGHRFAACDALVTNFHLPRSTLLMLTGALMGRGTILAAYAHAVRAGYRFHSYGDAGLLLPRG